MTLALDAMPAAMARAALTRCCGATRWVEAMADRRPFGDLATAQTAASEVWAEMTRDDILEAFEHHPQIGADLDALRDKFGAVDGRQRGDLGWPDGEQSGAHAADEQTLLALRDGNLRYRERFGHIFIVCATGKSAAEMLGLLTARLDHDPNSELQIAADEQLAITHLRLAKLAAEDPT